MTNGSLIRLARKRCGYDAHATTNRYVFRLPLGLTRRRPIALISFEMKVAVHVPSRTGLALRLLAVTLLGGGVLTNLSCEHRAATAKPRAKKEKAPKVATLKVWDGVATDEPPPTGFLASGEPEKAEPEEHRDRVPSRSLVHEGIHTV